MPKVDRHESRLLAATLGITLLLAGCVALPTQPTPAQTAAAAHAQTLYRQGDLAGAAQAYQSLADTSRGLRDGYLLRAAETWRQVDDWTKVDALLQQINRRHLSAEQAQRFDLLTGEAALVRGDAEQALTATQNMLVFPTLLQPRVLELRARAQLATGDALAAARTRLSLSDSLHGFDREQNNKQLLAALASVDSARLQQDASTLPANDPLRPWLAQALKQQGSALATTLPQLDHPVGTMLPSGNQASTREGYQPPHKIALLLPASGPLQAAASAVDAGFLAAEQADNQRAANTQVDVFDSGGTAASALDAYQRAVSNG
ncbi:MAG: penicillin-binding protein activator, partial [Xanthomonadales bacterium]|nr:penicillin-binding protein activator [Xanthomonadales bacterium]